MLLQEGKTRPGQLGPFDKKWLMVAVQDLETKASAGKVRAHFAPADPSSCPAPCFTTLLALEHEESIV